MDNKVKYEVVYLVPLHELEYKRIAGTISPDELVLLDKRKKEWAERVRNNNKNTKERER